MNTAQKIRGRQRRPTTSEVAAAWSRLRTAADRGDIQASALLIALSERQPLFPSVELHA